MHEPEPGRSEGALDEFEQPNATTPAYTARTNAFTTLRDKIYMHRLPSYGNKIFFGLGFLALTSLAMLFATGFVLAFMGQSWWLSDSLGIYVRSVHLWSVQALIAILILHGLVGFTTSGFKAPRRMVWVFGALMFCLILFQTEFGYGLRGDFSAQFRATSGADFWNGAYLGWWINPLSHLQEYALHIAIIPILLFLFFVLHYLLERTYGIATPYRGDIKVRMVPADHRIMYLRGGALVFAILVMAYIYQSPYVPAIRIADIANGQGDAVATVLLQEFDRTSDTATYLDSIDPYTFDTRQVFVVDPYESLVGSSPSSGDAWQTFKSASPDAQRQYLSDADSHFGVASDGLVDAASSRTGGAATDTSAAIMGASGAAASRGGSVATSSDSLEASTTATTTSSVPEPSNPVIIMVSTLLSAAKSGVYEALLDASDPAPHTYTLRFLVDLGAPEDKAGMLDFSTEKWGMAKDETGHMFQPTPGSWWFAPLGILNTVFDLPNNDNGDRIAAEVLGLFMLVMVTFPYIPYVNRIPELLGLAPYIWKDRESES